MVINIQKKVICLKVTQLNTLKDFFSIVATNP